MNKLAWYRNRLRQMEPHEMVWRARMAARVPFDYLKSITGIAGTVNQPVGAWWNGASYPISFGQLPGRSAAGTPSASTIRIFDLEFPASFQFDWHRDYSQGITAPRTFSRTLDIRDTRRVGDIKYIWEMNRHQHLSALAYSGDPDANTLVLTALGSWIAANPHLSGVNWTSSLELGLRLISWAFLYPVVRPRLAGDRALRESFAASVYLHLREIRGHLSLYSSANNHLIGELAGLYIGSTCFPWWPECARLRSEARTLLEREIQLQFTPQGVNREQAISYQLFTLELLLAAALVARNSGEEFSQPYWDRIRAALQYLAALATPAGELPAIGDSDDARGFLLSLHDSPLQVVMQLGALVFDDRSFAAFAPGLTKAAQALVPDAGARLARFPRSQVPAAPSSQVIPEAVALISDRDWKLLMDVGPLGYTSIAAHGHADALSLLLAIGDEYLMVDAGTYAYHSHPEWRNYFRGTSAHNTACIDGQNQSVIAGRFLWSSRAPVRLLEHHEDEHRTRISAEHDGYCRLTDPVVHRRTVALDKLQQDLVVEDCFVCAAEHQVELFWHFSEKAHVSQISPSTIAVDFCNQRFHLESSGLPLAISVVRGSAAPILGWRSPAFSRKLASPTVRAAGRIHGTSRIVTRISLPTSLLPAAQELMGDLTVALSAQA
jgi:hypothetical protein